MPPDFHTSQAPMQELAMISTAGATHLLGIKDSMGKWQIGRRPASGDPRFNRFFRENASTR